MGEDEPRQIASGIRDHYDLNDLQDKKVLVVCNLKASKIVGFSSNGMVLAAKVSKVKQQLYFPSERSDLRNIENSSVSCFVFFLNFSANYYDYSE